MQGKKDYQEKLFHSFQLSDRVPELNFYRRLKALIDFDFLYDSTIDIMVRVVRRASTQWFSSSCVW